MDIQREISIHTRHEVLSVRVASLVEFTTELVDLMSENRVSNLAMVSICVPGE